MTIWEQQQGAERIVKVPSDVPTRMSHAFGRPYVTAYQLAIGRSGGPRPPGQATPDPSEGSEILRGPHVGSSGSGGCQRIHCFSHGGTACIESLTLACGACE